MTQCKPEVVRCAIFRKQNDVFEVLLVRRIEHDVRGGEWELPGGGVEADETPEAAICREVMEEIGITITPNNLKTGIFSEALSWDRPQLFFATIWNGQIPQLGYEHDSYQWAPLPIDKRLHIAKTTNNCLKTIKLPTATQ